jgi:hypothetical protein
MSLRKRLVCATEERSETIRSEISMVGFSSPIQMGRTVETVSILGCAQIQLAATNAPRNKVAFLVNMIKKNKSTLGHDKNSFFVSLGSMTCPGSLTTVGKKGLISANPLIGTPWDAANI